MQKLTQTNFKPTQKEERKENLILVVHIFHKKPILLIPNMEKSITDATMEMAENRFLSVKERSRRPRVIDMGKKVKEWRMKKKKMKIEAKWQKTKICTVEAAAEDRKSNG